MRNTEQATQQPERNNSLRLPVELASSALKLCRLSSLAVNIGYNGFNYNNAD